MLNMKSYEILIKSGIFNVQNLLKDTFLTAWLIHI